jgi:uncharacterized protein HemX
VTNLRTRAESLNDEEKEIVNKYFDLSTKDDGTERKNAVQKNNESSPDSSRTKKSDWIEENKTLVICLSIAAVLILGAGVYFFILKKH